MALSIETVQQGVLDLLDAAIAQPIYEQSIPDINTVRRNETTRKIDPYVAIQFGDLQQGRRYNMATPMGDDYILPIYTQAIAPTAKVARQINNRVVMALLAQSLPWAGSIRKRSGGNMWPLVNSNAATEAYSAPASFGLLVQLSNDA